MRNKSLLCLALSSTIYLCGCGESAPSVAERKGDLISVDLSAVKDTVDINLSEWVEPIEIVQLESTETNMFLEQYSQVHISENYILAGKPLKLFNRESGKYISKIGHVGRGPGEYQVIYDVQIDEKNRRVFVTTFNAKSILVYNFEGKFISGIPLAFPSPKGRINVSLEDNEVIASTFTLANAKVKPLWVQDTLGNVKSYVEHTRFAPIKMDFSNEVFNNNNTDDFDFSIVNVQNMADTLYNYNAEDNSVKAVFTVTVPNLKPAKGYKNVIWRSYNELNSVFLYSFSGKNTQVGANSYQGGPPVYMYISKDDLSGHWYKLVNDYLANNIVRPSFSNGYYVQNIEPLTLLESLKDNRTPLSSKQQKRVDKLNKSIDQEGNNVIIIGKLI